MIKKFSLCFVEVLPLVKKQKKNFCAVTFQGLSHHGKDSFLAALMHIPHGLRTMYVHAYQSYLWNAATSERCLRYGTDRVVEGDLVLLSGGAQDVGLQENGRKSACA